MGLIILGACVQPASNVSRGKRSKASTGNQEANSTSLQGKSGRSKEVDSVVDLAIQL